MVKDSRKFPPSVHFQILASCLQILQPISNPSLDSMLPKPSHHVIIHRQHVFRRTFYYQPLYQPQDLFDQY